MPQGIQTVRSSQITTLLGRILPTAWSEVESRVINGRHYVQGNGTLRYLQVTESIQIVQEKPWLHLGISWTDHAPSMAELTMCKRIFAAPTMRGIQVFPPNAEHISLHPHCHHIYICLCPDGGCVPDFRIRENGKWGI